jgi:hypothetical protein
MVLFLDKEIPKKVKQGNLSLLDVIAFCKLLENYILKRRYMNTIETLEVGQLTSTISTLFDSLPKLLLDIDSVTDFELKRKLLNVLFSSVIIYRQFKVSTKPSANTMLSAYSGKRDLESLVKQEFNSDSIKLWIESQGLDLEEIKSYSNLSIYSGNASSPSGGASSSNILQDVAAVSKDTVLFTAIKNLASHFKGYREFVLLIETLALNVSIDKEFAKDAIHSRLFHFTAPGGKSRVIANVDWLSQTALSAIHFTLFKLLSSLKSDCTFNHKEGLSLYDGFSDQNSYFSIDLSAATDRMPRLLQSQLISGIWSALGFDGPKIAQSWLGIVDREYNTEKSKINNGNSVRYAVGQGMGLFSSWVAMAITHHYIVNHLCKISHNNYKLVGDDLLIKGTIEDYNAYLSVMASIGLEVNQNKTISSVNTKQHNIEFARNYIISGLRITPLPFGQLFAFEAGTAPFEASVSLITDVWSPLTLKRFSDKLMVIDIGRVIELCYFLYIKKGIPWPELPWLDTISKNPIATFVSKANFDKIAVILQQKLESNTLNIAAAGLNTVSFLNALKSQCTVRSIKDILRSKEFSESVWMLQYADDGLIEAANLIHNRLVNAQVVTYDPSDLGTPLLTKREKKLLVDAMLHYTKLNKKRVIKE